MYLYNLFLIRYTYYYKGENYYIFHNEYFDDEKFNSHLEECLPELINFYKNELPILERKDRINRETARIAEIQNWSEKQKKNFCNKFINNPNDEKINEAYAKYLKNQIERSQELEHREIKKPLHFEWDESSIGYLINLLCEKFGYEKFDNIMNQNFEYGEIPTNGIMKDKINALWEENS